MDIQVMISIWPLIGEGSDFYQALDQAGSTKPSSKVLIKIYDAHNPAARDMYWHGLMTVYLSWELMLGGWMAQSRNTSTVMNPWRTRPPCSVSYTAAGSWARVLNGFSLATTRGVYHNQRATTEDQRVFILSRSAWAGQQHYGSATWSGDISANWHTFAAQIPSGLNFVYRVFLTGRPIPGRSLRMVVGRTPDGAADPAYRELYLRWFQYSVFCPPMRSHGTQTPREIWNFGEPGDLVYDRIKYFAELRRQLMPYSYSLAAHSCFNGSTPMRLSDGLPARSEVFNIGDQFMYGPAFMVALITEPIVNAPKPIMEPIRALINCQVDGKPGLHVQTYSGIDSTSRRLMKSNYNH